MSKRVLITGNGGYIGSIMAPMFQDAGHDVVGLDTGYYRECTLVPDRAEVPTIRKDIRDLDQSDLDGFDAVVHLAALSNDPIGNLNSGWTEDINFRASVQLATLAKSAGVQRFLFSSSCIMYGVAKEAVATEQSPVDPKTEYAASKVKSENAIGSLAGNGFSPTFLRNGTVYGISPRMRFDTVLNDLTASAVANGKVVLHGDGTPWRPVVHVQDVSRSFLHVLEAPIDKVHDQAFNNGANHLNYRILDLAEVVAETVPDCEIEVLSTPSADQRTYKADFGKFARAFPDFEFEWNPKTGALELYEAFRDFGLTQAIHVDRRFTRLKWLTFLLESGRLDESLRWQTSGAAVR